MLSKSQTNILKELYPHQQLTEADFETKFQTKSDNPSIKTLFREDLLYLDSSRLYQPKLIYLTEHGRAYVEKKKEENRSKLRDDINTVLALLALVVAVIALFN